MPALSTPSPLATNTIDCSQTTSHRSQSMGPDLHPRLLRVAVTRILSFTFGRLRQLVLGQICLEMLPRLTKDAGIWNTQEGITEGESFLTSLIAFYNVTPGSVDDGGAAHVVNFDFSKVFDTIFYSIFIAKLVRYGLEG